MGDFLNIHLYFLTFCLFFFISASSVSPALSTSELYCKYLLAVLAFIGLEHQTIADLILIDKTYGIYISFGVFYRKRMISFTGDFPPDRNDFYTGNVPRRNVNDLFLSLLLEISVKKKLRNLFIFFM